MCHICSRKTEINLAAWFLHAVMKRDVRHFAAPMHSLIHYMIVKTDGFKKWVVNSLIVCTHQTKASYSYLWSADFVEGNKDGRVQEAAEGEIRVKGPRGHQQQDRLWHERRQAKPLAPPAVCTGESRRRSVETTAEMPSLKCWAYWGPAVKQRQQVVLSINEVICSSYEYLQWGRACKSTERSCVWCLFWSHGRGRSRGGSPIRTWQRRTILKVFFLQVTDNFKNRNLRHQVTARRLASHVVEEWRERTKHSAGHAGEEEQLRVEKASDETRHGPPPVVALRWRSARRSQRQCDGQSVRHRVDLHVDGETVEQRGQRQVSGCGKKETRLGKSINLSLLKRLLKTNGDGLGPTRSYDL